jgi:hypothetical protein
MTGPVNQPRVTRYTRINDIPPGVNRGSWFEVESLDSNERNARYVDPAWRPSPGGTVSAEAEAILRAESDRLERRSRAQAEGWDRGGDPGE